MIQKYKSNKKETRVTISTIQSLNKATDKYAVIKHKKKCLNAWKELK